MVSSAIWEKYARVFQRRSRLHESLKKSVFFQIARETIDYYYLLIIYMKNSVCSHMHACILRSSLPRSRSLCHQAVVTKSGCVGD